jgi:hypothetical protein
MQGENAIGSRNTEAVGSRGVRGDPLPQQMALALTLRNDIWKYCWPSEFAEMTMATSWARKSYDFERQDMAKCWANVSLVTSAALCTANTVMEVNAVIHNIHNNQRNHCLVHITLVKANERIVNKILPVGSRSWDFAWGPYQRTLAHLRPHPAAPPVAGHDYLDQLINARVGAIVAGSKVFRTCKSREALHRLRLATDYDAPREGSDRNI